jgi:geranylgeranyl diphosphate synthase, type II
MEKLAMDELAINMAAERALVEEHLDRYLKFPAGCPERLQEALRYSVLAPGKRLRPLLVLMAARACGGKTADAIPAACAVELIHTYSLIHDDLPAMDDDDLRRGRPTCHRQFDEATAILAGDALIPLAFEIICRDSSSPEIAARCCHQLAIAAGATQLVGGQVDDLAAQFHAMDLEKLEQIHLRKTAAMIAVSLSLGAITASATEVQRETLEKFGKNLGLAFQITDDLLDLQGEEVKMGKRVRKDRDLGKLTYPAVLGSQDSSRLANLLVDDSIKLLEGFGDGAEPLISLARFVVSRSR